MDADLVVLEADPSADVTAFAQVAEQLELLGSTCALVAAVEHSAGRASIVGGVRAVTFP